MPTGTNIGSRLVDEVNEPQPCGNPAKAVRNAREPLSPAQLRARWTHTGHLPLVYPPASAGAVEDRGVGLGVSESGGFVMRTVSSAHVRGYAIQMGPRGRPNT